MSTEMPQHKHDCECCKFLGLFDHDGTIYDLYYHGVKDNGFGTTVIARYGELGDYHSGLVFAKLGHQPLAETLRRAKEAGLYVEWIECDGEIWDYEKTFYRVKLKNKTEAWVWPNAGHLTDCGFDSNAGRRIPIESVAYYCEDEEAYWRRVRCFLVMQRMWY